MEDSLGQKWKHREFALASVSDLSSPPSSASPGIARFDSDGLQIHHQSHQIPLSVHPRTVQLFKVSPVLSVCVVEGSDAGKKTLYSRAVTIQFRNEEESAAFHCVVQQWKKEVNTQEGNERIGTITASKSKFDEKIESSSAKMYFHYYGQLLHQQNMLQDYVRTGTYHAAVIENRADFIGRVVVDVGAGSGILSLFAAQAGAKHVYAVEASEMAEYARKLIAGNPTLAQRITVIKGKVEDVELPEKADILISEPMGTLLVNERMLESYVIARDRFLSPTGKMFPAVGRIHMAPFTDEYLFIEIANKSLVPIQGHVGYGPLSIDKLDGTNYDTWASDIKLWLKGQDYVAHLTQTVTSVDEKDRPRWSKIDAQICSVLKSTIHPSLKQIFRAHETCVDVWEQARLLYTNDTQRLYGVCQNLQSIISPRRLEGSMAEYLGKVHGLLHDFNELLPPAATPAKELEQRQTFFMLMALYGLPDEYSSIRDQILGSPTVPTLNSAWSTLLRVPCKSFPDIPSSAPTGDSSALVSQRDDCHRSRKLGKGRPKCDHCHKLGHTIDRCYVLHGRPTHPATAVAHTTSSVSIASGATPSDGSGSGSEPPALFHDFLKWYEERQAFNSTASIARTRPSFVGLTHSSSFGPWVLDSGATDHISGPEFGTDDWHRM